MPATAAASGPRSSHGSDVTVTVATITATMATSRETTVGRASRDHARRSVPTSRSGIASATVTVCTSDAVSAAGLPDVTSPTLARTIPAA